MPLSDKEIKELMEKAGFYMKTAEENNPNDLPYFQQALACYNRIIEDAVLHSHYFSERAKIKYNMFNRLESDSLRGSLLEEAIEDINKAIELDSDKGQYYDMRGSFLWRKLEEDNFEGEPKNKNEIWKNIISDFKNCISKDPTEPKPWLNLIRINIITLNWYDAVSLYGACKPYIHKKEDRLNRAWFGCLAILLASDNIEEEDKKPLHDQIIRLNTVDYEIISFLNEISKNSEFKERWSKIDEIIELYITHFDNWNDKADIYKNLDRFEEALHAYCEATLWNPNDAWAWCNKGMIFIILQRYQEALEALDRAIEIDPNNVTALHFKSIVLSSHPKSFERQK